MRIIWMISACVVAVAATAARADRVIDDFNYADGRISFPSDSTAPPTLRDTLLLSDSHILGGTRFLDFRATQKPARRSAIMGVAMGTLGLDTGSGVVTESTVRWDGGGSLLVDLTNGGDDHFGVNLIATDLNLTLALAVVDWQGRRSLMSKSLSSPSDVSYYYSAFTGNADFTRVTAIEMWFTGPAAIDMRLDWFGTEGGFSPDTDVAPEPGLGVMAASGLGLAGLVRMLRRRRSSAAALAG